MGGLLIPRGRQGHRSLPLGGPGIIDLATLNLNAWWPGPYAASPWEGAASGGSSGTRDLTEATNPPSASTELNGVASALFDGTNDILNTGLSLANLMTSTVGWGWGVAEVISASGNDGAATPYNNQHILRDAGSYFGLTVRSSGKLQLYTHDAGGWDAVEEDIPIGTNTPFVYLWKMTDGAIYLKVNDGDWTSGVARAAIDNTGFSTTIGGPSFVSTFFNGRIWEIAYGAGAVPPEDTFTSIRLTLEDTYGL